MPESRPTDLPPALQPGEQSQLESTLMGMAQPALKHGGRSKQPLRLILPWLGRPYERVERAARALHKSLVACIEGARSGLTAREQTLINEVCNHEMIRLMVWKLIRDEGPKAKPADLMAWMDVAMRATSARRACLERLDLGDAPPPAEEDVWDRVVSREGEGNA